MGGRVYRFGAARGDPTSFQAPPEPTAALPTGALPMRILALLPALALAGCCATPSTTAYVAQAAPAAVCAPAPQAAPARVVYLAPAPTAPACSGGSCAVPAASAGPAQAYAVTSTRYTLNEQAASLITIPPDLFICGGQFARCVWNRIFDPLLPPPNPSGGYSMSGR